jgi:hypothetical protein
MPYYPTDRDRKRPLYSEKDTEPPRCKVKLTGLEEKGIDGRKTM